MLTRIRRLLFVTAFALCCAHSVAAQERCELHRAIAPDYGGVMLGMTLGELREMFPGAQELRSGPPAGELFNAQLGMLDLNIRKEAFKGVEELSLGFIAGRVHKIGVRFRPPPSWADIDEFSDRMAKRLALPAASWGPTVRAGTKESRVMDCRGFSVIISREQEGASTLIILDTTAPRETKAAPPSLL